MIRNAIGLSVLMLISFGVNALGFRSITVHSLLNQPLDARIELVAVDPLETEDLRVSLAGEEVFEKAGVPRRMQLGDLTFRPRADAQGRVFIHVTSRNPIREPFLDFLIEVAFKDVRLVREYTVLLDLPPAVAGPTRAPEPNREQALSGPPSSPTPDRAVYPQAGYGPVKQGETLWTIAERLRPDASVTVEQMMMALFYRNPDAFQQSNVNLIKRGSRLVIPDRDSIERLPPFEARQAFLQQTRDWRALKGGKVADRAKAAARAESVVGDTEMQSPTAAHAAGMDTTVEAPPPADTGSRSPASTSPSVGEGERHAPALRVLEMPAEDEATGTGAVAESAPSGDSALRQDIAAARKDLAAVREINQDLAELQDVLEEKISALRRSLTEKDRLIEELEEKARAVLSPSAAQPLQPAGEITERKMRPVVPVTPDAAGKRPAPRAEMPGPEVGDRRISVAGEQPPIVRQAAPLSLDWMQPYWLPLAVLVFLSASLVIGVVVRRRRASRIADYPVFSAFEDLQESADLGYVQPGGADAVPLSEDRQFRLDVEDDGLRLSDDPGVESALTEADIFLAYRRYGQAEGVVREAVEKNPDSMLLRAKLLEIHAFRADKKKFAALMEDSYLEMSAREPEIWAKVVEMGRDLIPEHKLISRVRLPEAGYGDRPESTFERDDKGQK